MADLLPQPEVCWADATIISNFEAATLPLLYAPEDDCKQYFQAMKRKNPRKGLGLEAVFALCLQARAAKEQCSYLEALRLLREGADRRLQLFHCGDYQVVAAYEHCVWSAIHLGVLELSSTKSSAACAASTLFSFGVDVLRSCRGGGSEGSSILSPFVVASLEFVLHYNWTSYFVHRAKWHAAAHHAQLTLQRWKKLSVGATQSVSDVDSFGRFLAVRRLVAEERIGEQLHRVRKDLQQLLQQTGCSGAVDNSAPTEADSGDASAAPPPEADPAVPTVLTIAVVFEGEERELTVCLSATRPQNAWDGPMDRLTAFLTSYGLCLCDASLKDYSRALTAVLPKPIGNPLWSNYVDGLHDIVQAKHSASTVLAESVHPMPASMTRSEGLQIQRIMKKYMLSERARKQRKKLEQERRQHLIDEGMDNELEPEELEAKWRIAPSPTEVSGLLVEEARQNASVAAFTSMFPLLQRRVAAKEALRVLEEAHTSIVSPAEAARCTTETRQAQHRPHTTAAQYKADTVEEGLGARRPVSVEPMRSSMIPPSRLSGMQPSQESPSGTRRVPLPEETLLAYASPGAPTQRVGSPSPIPKEVRSPTSRCSSASSKALTAGERRALLGHATTDLIIREVETSIDGKQAAYRRSASVLRSFAESLAVLADLYEKKADTMDQSRGRFEAAMSKYVGQEPSSAGQASDAGDGHVSGAPTPVRSGSPAVASCSVSPTRDPNRAVFPPTAAVPKVSATDDGALDAVRQKQRQLRALLPSIDHHSTAYRMVVNELADNERQLQEQRDAATTAQLARDAQIGAARRKSMAHSSHSRGGDLPHMTHPHDRSASESTLAAGEVSAACLWLCAIAFCPAAPSVPADGEEEEKTTGDP